MGNYLRALPVLLLMSSFGLRATHLYAVSGDRADPGLRVYEVRSDGSLSYIGKTSGPANTQLVATPGGRYIYQFDGRWISQFDVLDNGTLQQSFPPVTYETSDDYPGFPGIFALAMHPSGDYLYVAADWTTIHVFRTGDVDGHLTQIGKFSCANCNMLAMDPTGEFLFVGGNSDQPDPGPMRMIATYRVNQVDGSLTDTGKRWYGPGLDQGGMQSDHQYVYCTTRESDDNYTFHALAIQSDGTLVEAARANAKQFAAIASAGRNLISSATGKGSDVRLYNILSHQFVLASTKPTEVMYSLTPGTGRLANVVWVTTDDGIVTYAVNDGQLVRIGKVMIPFANPVFYVSK